MLRRVRFVQCALIASSCLFTNSRGSSSGRCLERKKSHITPTRLTRQHGGDTMIDDISTTNINGGNSDVDDVVLDVDLVLSSVEGEGSMDESLLGSSRAKPRLSNLHHYFEETSNDKRRRSSQMSAAFSSLSVTPSLSQRVLRRDGATKPSKRQKKTKHAADVEETMSTKRSDEEDETKNKKGYVGTLDVISNYVDGRVGRSNKHNNNDNGNNHHNATRSENSSNEQRGIGGDNDTVLSNPFGGLHDHITRSYRLDQLLAVAQPEDFLLGRQETKSGAFSFIRFSSSPQFLADASKGPMAENSKGVACNDCALLVAERLLSFPPHMQHFHSICGRDNVPCDFFADIDLSNESVESGEKLLLEMLTYLEVRLHGIGFLHPSFLILTNEVPDSDKVSYHVHARSMGVAEDGVEEQDEEGEEIGGKKKKKEEESINGDDINMDNLGKKKKKASSKSSLTKKNVGGSGRNGTKKIIAFQDYRVVKLLADEVNMTLGRAVIDEQCYRLNGMLRCAFSSKIVPSLSGGTITPKGKRLVPLLKARDTMLQRRLNDITAQLQTFSEAEILERSFSVRLAPITAGHNKQKDSKNALRSFKLLRARHVLGPKDAQPLEFDAYGNAVSAYLTEGAKWRRFKAVIEKLRRMPPSTAESYDLWVRVGLALHNFSNEDHVFEEWVRFSLKCPQKYSRESCRKKWQQFERNPDALNWRRGFNYLNTTVWRSVRGT